MITQKDYIIEVRTSSPSITSIGQINQDFIDNNSIIDEVGDEEGSFHYETIEKVQEELEKLKKIQPLKIPEIKFRIVEKIINKYDWK
jgi:agmatine/peptidylarginine deiminase